MSEKTEQVAKQCKVVAHLARTIAQVHEDKAMIYGATISEKMADFVGRETAELMETLGEILNGMDAASDEDAWTHPVFAEAQRLWPSASRSTPSK